MQPYFLLKLQDCSVNWRSSHIEWIMFERWNIALNLSQVRSVTVEDKQEQAAWTKIWRTFNSYMFPCEVSRYWKTTRADRLYLSSGRWRTVTLATCQGKHSITSVCCMCVCFSQASLELPPPEAALQNVWVWGGLTMLYASRASGSASVSTATRGYCRLGNGPKSLIPWSAGICVWYSTVSSLLILRGCSQRG